jgi:YebC/PmpR family DNA-binding regulatory protein
MAGHSKWKQIKHKKEITDKKRGQLFAKLLNAIRLAAKNEPNPDFNPRLRTAIEKAKEAQVPQENIERALKQSNNESLEEVIIEAYGPGGSALIIEAVTDNRHRTINEIKSILSDWGAKFSEPGSVRWLFTKSSTNNQSDWQANFKQELKEDDRQKLNELIKALEEHDDVQKVFTNA